MKRCEECGSWEAQCAADTPAVACGCVRCSAVEREESTEAYRRLMIAYQEMSHDFYRQQNWIADRIKEIMPVKSCSQCRADNPEDGSSHIDHFFDRAAALFAADAKRCESCTNCEGH